MLIERWLADVVGEPVRVVRTESLGGDFAPVERLTLTTGRTVIKKRRRRRVRLSGLIVATLDALAESGAFPGLAAWFGDVLAEAKARWPEVTGPPEYFPAFH